MSVKPHRHAAPRDGNASSGKIANRLVALSSAAVLAVYAAGYARTRSAAQRFEAAERPRGATPAAIMASGPITASAPATVAAPSPLAPATPVAEPSVPASPPAPVEAQGVPAATSTQAEGPTKKGPSVPKTPSPQAAAPAPAPAETPAAPVVATVAEATPAVVEPPAVPAPPPQPQYRDGAYSGWGRSRHGDIEATVWIEGGRIVSAVISKCLTRYSCAWVEHLQGQVVARQSAEVDYVSRATESANAFYYAVVEALSKAK